MIPPAIFFPLAAAMVYAAAALFLNAAGRNGVGRRMSTAVCNVFLAILMAGFYDWSAFPQLPDPFWPVFLLAVFFVLGQGFTILALSVGEVSTVAPVMGLKVLFVNFLLAAGLREPVGLNLWIAALLSVAGVAALQANPGKKIPSTPGALRGMLYAMLSALFFAGADVLIQEWTPRIGFPFFLPPAMLLAALMSVSFLFAGADGMRALSRRNLKTLLPGGMLLALQSLLLIFAIGRYGQVAQANIIYSSRGVWSVLFVWFFGHIFANAELKNATAGRLAGRLTGALLISAAITLVLIE